MFTLNQIKNDNINQIITITDDLYLVDNINRGNIKWVWLFHFIVKFDFLKFVLNEKVTPTVDHMRLIIKGCIEN